MTHSASASRCYVITVITVFNGNIWAYVKAQSVEADSDLGGNALNMFVKIIFD